MKPNSVPDRARFAMDVSKAAHAVGYAIGVLQGLADMTKLNERQLGCVDVAADGLAEIDFCKLAQMEEGE